MARPHVVVIGAGLSGVCAAERLVGACDVTVVDAAARVGGRTLALPVAPGAPAAVDGGGQWLGAAQGAVLSLARRLGATLQPQFASGRRVLQLGARVASYTGLIPDVSWGVLADAQVALLVVKALQAVVRAWPDGRAAAWLDSVSVERFCRATMWTDGGRALLRIVVQAFLGREPRDASVLALLRYVNASGSVEAMSEVGPGSLQAWTLVGGAQQLSERVAAAAVRRGAALRLGARVVAVRRADDGSLAVELADGAGAIACTHVVVAAPPSLAAAIAWSPPLPPPRAAAMGAAAMGCIIKALIVYPSAFWRDAGFSGEAVVDVESHPARGPAFNFFDACVPVRAGRDWDATAAALGVAPGAITPAPGGATPLRFAAAAPSAQVAAAAAARGSGGAARSAPSAADLAPVPASDRFLYLPALVAFVNADAAARSSAADPPARRRAAVLAQVSTLFGAPPEVAAAPLAFIEKDWAADPFTRGCPTAASWGARAAGSGGAGRAVLDPNVLAAPCWRDDDGGAGSGSGSGAPRLFWAGTETSPVGTGFMDGAVRAGHRAAAEVLAAVGAPPGAGGGDDDEYDDGGTGGGGGAPGGRGGDALGASLLATAV